jgi:GST-like protein
MFKLFAKPGWGSVLTEAQLAWYGLPHEIEDVENPFTSEAGRARLAPYNKLTQLPTLILPDGQVMTESAAITLHLADVAGSDALVPAPGSPERAAFLRWLVFIVANIYPTFTYADLPERFVAVEAARAPFRDSVDAYAQRLWHIMEAEAGHPWFLGPRFSALDLFIAVITRWRPNRPWFATNCPSISTIALAAEARPELTAVWQRNFPPG